MRRWASLVLGAVMGAHSASGAAQQDAPLQGVLSVEPSADGCITQSALSTRVRRLLERDRVLGQLEVEVDAAHEPVGFLVRRDGEVVAERRFALLPAGCAERLDALALAITLAIEHATSTPIESGSGSEAGAAAGAGAKAGAGSSAAETQPPVTAPDESPSPAPPAERTSHAPPGEAGPAPARAATAGRDGALGVNLFAGGTWLIEALPAPLLAIAAGGGVQLAPLRIELGALISPERNSELGTAESRLQLVGGRTHVCLGWPTQGLELAGCAGFGAGVVFAQGDGYFEDRSAKMIWAAALLRAALRYPAGSLLSGRLAIDGLVNLVRPELQVERPAGPTQADTTGPLGVALSLELVMALP